jgi:Pyruvate/2-oxoacid:ferredoxin oxidoreductase gamma subunit
MLGAFAKTTGLLGMESIYKAIDKRFPERLAESNKKASLAGYDRVVVKKS